MSQYYSDPTREHDTYALPDVEVFYSSDMPCEECDACDACDACDGTGHKPAGYYYWYCFPGCMPEGGAWGPYDTENEAVEAMRDESY